MASEKSRYLKHKKDNQPEIDWQEMPAILSQLPNKTLTDILVQGAEYSEPLRRSLHVWAAYAMSDGESADLLEKSIRYAMDLTDCDIHYSESNSYAQIVHAVQTGIEELAAAGKRELASNLCDLAIELGEAGSEVLQDGHSWDMAVDNLSDLNTKLFEGK